MITFYFLTSLTFASLLMTTDALLMMNWAIAFYFLVKAIENDQLITWCLVGIFVGIGSLGKYTELLFLVSLFLFLCIQKDKRYLLRKLGPYLVLFFSFFVLLPNIIWNLKHHAATFHHVWVNNIGFSGLQFHMANFSAFFFGQFLVFSPVLFLPLIYFIFSKFNDSDYKYNLLRCFSGVMLLLMFLQSLLSNANVNWAAAAYISSTIFVCHELISRRKKLFLLINLYLMFGCSIAFYCIISIIGNDAYFQKHNIGALQYGSFHKEITSEMATIRKKYPNAFFVFDDRYIWATFSYYGELPYDRVCAYSATDDFSSDTSCFFMPESTAGGNMATYIYITHNTRNIDFLIKTFQIMDLTVSSLKLRRIMNLNVYLLVYEKV